MIRQSKAMDVVWSREFLFALLLFMAPTAVAAGFAYRWIRRSSLCRKRVAPRPEPRQEVSEKSEPLAEPVVPAVIPAASARPELIHEALEKLKQRLVEFQAFLQESRRALESLQQGDSRCVMELERACEALRRPISKAAQSGDTRSVSSAA